MAVTPLAPQDVADCVNALGLTKDQFTTFLSGAVLLAQRNQVLAQIQAAQAAQAQANASTASTISGLQAQLAAVDAQYQSTVAGH